MHKEGNSMLFKVANIILDIQPQKGSLHSEAELTRALSKKLRIGPQYIHGLRIDKYSIDARKKPKLKGVYTVIADITQAINTNTLKKANASIHTPKVYQFPNRNEPFSKRPLIIGSGPAGLFAAYVLAMNGHRPIVIEQGDEASIRRQKIQDFFKTGQFDSYSNIQFGEGGAGTFSDGKLNTGVKDKFLRKQFILETFVEHGADPSILYMNKPHVGTDYLIKIVENMRKTIIQAGGSYYFNTFFDKPIIQEGKIIGAKCLDLSKENAKIDIECDHLILAIGHSSRHTFESLYKSDVHMEAKAFAMGLRIEHPQEWINAAQYGFENLEYDLPSADYKLTYQASNGRGVYSFCMCPGGYVVNGASEEGRVVCNGMSLFARNSKNANSAIIATVTPEDFGNASPLAGIDFQRKWEEMAYKIAGSDYSLPTQDYVNFRKDVTNSFVKESISDKAFFQRDLIESTCQNPLTDSPLKACLPKAIAEALVEGIDYFGGIIEGFNHPKARLIGVETRTSSPVRILRNEQGMSNIAGLYPSGEGAGYAGGIMSAAIDGIKTAEMIVTAKSV